MNLLITICARGGSKGIPGKNLSWIGGVPLLSYSICVAKEFAKLHNADLELSTDSNDIKLLSSKYGLETEYTRPAYLATDFAGKIDTINDLLSFAELKNKKKYDYILDLDVTSPLRTVKDLQDAFNLIVKDDKALNLFSVSKPHRNPYFNQVELKSNGYFNLVKNPLEPILSRQTSPIVWDLNASFYIYRRSFFELGFRNAYTDSSLIFEVPHICFDLDEPLDFEFMAYLIENKRLDFELMGQ